MPTTPTLPASLARYLPPRMRRPLAHALAAGAVVACLALLLPNQYKAEARILPDAGHGPATPRTGVWAPSAQPELPGSREDGPTIIFAEILKSRRVADALLTATYDYGCRAWRFGRVRRERGTLLDYLEAPDTDRALGAFRRLLTVERSPKSGLLTVAAETRSPELSMLVARGAVAELRAALVDLSQAEGRSRARNAGERLEEVDAFCKAQAEAFRRFQEANRNWEASPEPNLRFQGTQLRQQLALWQRVQENLTLNHEQALVEARNDAQPLLVLDPGGLPREKSRPHRSFLVLGAFGLTFATSWTVLNPRTVHDLFLSREKP